MRLSRGSVTPAILAIRLSRSTLPLFVTRIEANDQHRTLTTDHFALLTHRFYRRAYFHNCSLSLLPPDRWIQPSIYSRSKSFHNRYRAQKDPGDPPGSATAPGLSGAVCFSERTSQTPTPQLQSISVASTLLEAICDAPAAKIIR